MERNVTLDFVRGVAILGILLLNISAFGLPKAAYLNPAWSGSASLSDAWTWALLDLLAQVKFLALFALLFGAGLQLLLPRGKRWIQSRLTLLALLGFIHGLFFWDGDILLAYALVGLVSWRMVREAQRLAQRAVQPASLPAHRRPAGGGRYGGQSAGNIRPVVSGLGLSLVCVFAAGAARTERPVAGNRLCLAGLGLLAAALPFPPGGRYRLRRTHGAD